MVLRITTNHVPRTLVYGYELTSRERESAGITADDAGEDTEHTEYVRYRGSVIPVNDFSADWGMTRGTGLPSVFAGWDGYLSDTYFSGLVIRYVRDESGNMDTDSVIIGRFAELDDDNRGTCVFCGKLVWRREEDGIYTRNVVSWTDTGDVSACPDSPSGTHNPHGNSRYVAVWHGGVNYSHGSADDAEWFGSVREAADAMRDRRTMGHHYPQTFRYVFRPADSALTPNAHDDNSGYTDLFRVDRNTTAADIRHAIYGGCPDYRIEFGERGGIVVNR